MGAVSSPALGAEAQLHQADSDRAKKRPRRCCSCACVSLALSSALCVIFVAATAAFFAAPSFHSRSTLRGKPYVDGNAGTAYPVQTCTPCVNCFLCSNGGTGFFYAQVAGSPGGIRPPDTPWGEGMYCLNEEKTEAVPFGGPPCYEPDSLAACEAEIVSIPCPASSSLASRLDYFCPCSLLRATSPGEKDTDAILFSEYRMMGMTFSNHKRSVFSALFPAYDYTRPSLATQLSAGIRAVHLRIQRGRAWTAFAMMLVDSDTTCASVRSCLSEIRTWSSAHPLHSPIVVILEISTDSTWEFFCHFNANEHMAELGAELTGAFGQRLINLTSARDSPVGYLRGGIGVVLRATEHAAMRCLEREIPGVAVAYSAPEYMAEINNTLADTTLIAPTRVAALSTTWTMRTVDFAGSLVDALNASASLVLARDGWYPTVAALCASDLYTEQLRQDHCAYLLTGVSTGTASPTQAPTSAPTPATTASPTQATTSLPPTSAPTNATTTAPTPAP